MSLVEPNPRQKQIVHMKGTGHFVVLGTAGTGKSLMAVLRALALSRGDFTRPPAPVLLITFNRALQGYLEHLLALYSGTLGTHAVEVLTYHKAMQRLLRPRRIEPRVIKDRSTRIGLLKRAVDDLAARGTEPIPRSPEFFVDEFDWIDGHGLTTLDDYLAASRVGRGVALQRAPREYVWALREEYRRHRARARYDMDWSGVAAAVRGEHAVRPIECEWRHVIVDECQDFSPEEIRSLVEIVPEDGSFTMFGDYAQRLYGGQLSWRYCGVSLGRHSVERFTENYRNPRPIARVALAVSEHPLFNDSEDILAATDARRDGVEPTLTRFSRVDDEMAAVTARATASTDRRVAILTHTGHDAAGFMAGVRGLGHKVYELKDSEAWHNDIGIWCGTYHSAKGLEFDTVYLPLWGVDDAPPLDASDDPDDLIARELKRLYVGITRSHRELHVSHSGDLSPLMPSDRSLYTCIDRSAP